MENLFTICRGQVYFLLMQCFMFWWNIAIEAVVLSSSQKDRNSVYRTMRNREWLWKKSEAKLKIETLLPPANEAWGKVIFLHLSVILFTGGVPGQVHPPGRNTSLGRYTPPGRYTPIPISACWHTVNKRAVRILLECILVYTCMCLYSKGNRQKHLDFLNKLLRIIFFEFLS